MDEIINGVMVYYIDVGNLAPHQAEALMEKLKASNKELVGKLKEQGIENIWVPIRPNSETRVEFIPFIDENKAEEYVKPHPVVWNEKIQGVNVQFMK